MVRGGKWICTALLAALCGGSAQAVVCVGDCNADGTVRVDELVRGVGLALGEESTESCDGFDAPPVRIESLIHAARNSLGACGPEGPYIGRPPALSFAAVVRNAPRRIDDVDTLAASPDGAHVYVASRLGIVVFARGNANGALQPVDYATAVSSVAAFAFSPDGAQLYAVESTPTADGWRMVVFARDSSSGALTVVQTLPLESSLPYLAISSDGHDVYLAGTEERDDRLPALYIFRRADSDGRLSQTATVSWDALGLVRVSALASAGDRVYVAGDVPPIVRFDSSLVELERRTDDGLAVLRQYERQQLNLWAASDLAVAPDGSLYLAGQELRDTFTLPVVLRLTRQSTDEPFAVATRLLGERNPIASQVAVSRDGGLLAVTGGGELTLYSVGEDGVVARGHLTSAGGWYTSGAVAFGRDGAQLYGATYVLDGLTVYATAPELTRGETWRGTLDGLDGIAGVRALAESPDAATLYATSVDHTLAAFARDTDSGELAPLQVVR